MVLVGDSARERFVTSGERIRDIGEVFTPNSIVQEMLDLLPATMWAVHPSPTFFEPACGDGNFLVAILARKLECIAKELSTGNLPGGATHEAALFHGLEALASIYAVDISVDNVLGGKPGHAIGARTRLLTMFSEWHTGIPGPTELPSVRGAAEWIVEHNVIVGNMLPFDAAGKPTGRDLLPLIEYTFEPITQSVVLRKTVMGDVIATEEAKSSHMLSLFGPPSPELLWQGTAINLAESARVETPKLVGPARNGSARRP